MNNNKLIIIAEAGVNHNGSLKKAYKLVEAAKYAGADYVKFQVFSPENLCIKDAKKANYQKKFNPKENQYQMLKKLSLKEKDFIRELIGNTYFLISISIFFSFLMNSKLHLFSLKFKNYTLRENLFKYVLMVLSVIFLITMKFLAVPIIILCYLILSIIKNSMKTKLS